MEKPNAYNIRAQLHQFTGSQTFYRNPLFPDYLYTEGARFIADEGGAYWLIDYVFTQQAREVLKEQPFQVWKITVQENESAVIMVEDGNQGELARFEIAYTDFPLEEFTFWLVDKTLLLPSEY